jgi:hypothetical protein
MQMLDRKPGQIEVMVKLPGRVGASIIHCFPIGKNIFVRSVNI